MFCDGKYCGCGLLPDCCGTNLFGLHNFKLVYELASRLGKKVGIIANKWMGSYDPIEDFCHAQSLPILAKIPYDSNLALLNSEGKIAAAEKAEYAELLQSCWRWWARRRAMKQLLILSGKGGTGKTTVAGGHLSGWPKLRPMLIAMWTPLIYI